MKRLLYLSIICLLSACSQAPSVGTGTPDAPYQYLFQDSLSTTYGYYFSKDKRPGVHGQMEWTQQALTLVSFGGLNQPGIELIITPDAYRVSDSWYSASFPVEVSQFMDLLWICHQPSNSLQSSLSSDWVTHALDTNSSQIKHRSGRVIQLNRTFDDDSIECQILETHEDTDDTSSQYYLRLSPQ